MAQNANLVERLRNLVATGRRRDVILQYLEEEFGITWSLSTLNRRLKRLGIKRRDHSVTFGEIAHAVAQERRGPGTNSGIRFMHLAIRSRHGLHVSQHQVAAVMRQTGLTRSFRRARTYAWQRRLVYCPGPNYRWCEDGYDKLGRWDIFIHGAVDEYSRRIMWLCAYDTNRRSELIVRYYLRTVEKFGVAPDFVSSDFGNESNLIAVCQASFYDDDRNPQGHHRWNYSVTNVAIESWWKRLRIMAAQYWINEFEELEEEGLWRGDIYDRWALLSIYIPLINKDLERVVFDHNVHTVRAQRGRLRPGGKPEDLYLLPENKGGRQCGKRIDNLKFNQAMSAVDVTSNVLPPVVPIFVHSIVEKWMRMNRVVITRQNAKLLYQQVRDLLLSC